MSKQAQDFLTVLIPVGAYLVSLLWMVWIVASDRYSTGAKGKALVGIVAYFAVTVLVVTLGAAPHIWRALAAPFVAG
jgi:hypothetical protein